MNYKFKTDEIETDATVTKVIRNIVNFDSNYTKMTMQVIDGFVPSTAGSIAVNAKVDMDDAGSTFQNIGTFDLTNKTPIFIQGTYEELEFVGSGMSGSGTEILVNGDFGAALGVEWALTVGVDGTLSIVTGELVFDQGLTAELMTAIQSFDTIVGEQYTVKFDLVSATDPTLTSIRIGTTSGGAEIVDNVNSTTGLAQRIIFTATATTTYITIQDSQAASATSNWDNISTKRSSSSYIAIAANR